MRLTVGSTRHNEEIDFYELYLMIRKRWWVVILVAVVSLCSALAYISTSPERYKVKNGIVLLNIVLTPEANAIVKNLNDQSKSFKARALGIPIEEMLQIESIRVQEIPYSKNQISNILQIEISAMNKDTAVKVMEALPRYVSTRPFIVWKIERKKKAIRREIDELDKVLKDPLGWFRLNTNVPVVLPDLYKYQERYIDRKIELEELSNDDIIMLADESAISRSSLKDEAKKIALLSFMMGLVLGVIAVFLFEWILRMRHAHDY